MPPPRIVMGSHSILYVSVVVLQGWVAAHRKLNINRAPQSVWRKSQEDTRNVCMVNACKRKLLFLRLLLSLCTLLLRAIRPTTIIEVGEMRISFTYNQQEKESLERSENFDVFLDKSESGSLITTLMGPWNNNKRFSKYILVQPVCHRQCKGEETRK